ncbi:hypothetical protein BGZ63DRAFT_421707 [Mariannaea sp. PMI_226]|nr:hypothetical protein BGZ63DRAFT_421707 [Mariannaea sp. PMI_226]
MAREEVSESVLSDGFSWSAKQPPCPGQFSQRHHPQPQISRIAVPSTQFTQTSNILPSNKSSPHGQTNVSPVHRPSAPQPSLDLPELGLPRIRTSHGSPSRDNLFGVNGTDRPNLASQDELRDIILPTNILDHSCKPPGSVHSKSKGKDKISPAQASSDPIQQQDLNTETTAQQKSSTPSRSAEAIESSRRSQHLQAESGSSQACLGIATKDKSVQNFDNLKLSVSHSTCNGLPQRTRPSSSVCGDLERPTPATPRSSRQAPSQTQDRMRSRPVRSPSSQPGEKRTHRNVRSQSRVSNISRKRSTIRKHRTRTDPERKKEAMHHVAQYWNECIRISEDERIQANLEIEQLQTELSLQEEKLIATIDTMKNKEVHVNKMQSRCAELEDQNQHASTENQRLNEEVNTLKAQLKESSKHISGLRDKFRSYRSKLNEAIAEQQALYTQSCRNHEDSKKQLENEKKLRVDESMTVQNAIAASSKKREELKTCIQKFREEADQESRRRDDIATELNAKLKQQETEIAYERKTVAELQRHIDKQEKIEHKIDDVKHQIQALAESNVSQHSEAEAQKETMSYLVSKLDHITEYLNKPAGSSVTSADMKNMTEALEENIVSKILTPVLSIISEQSREKEYTMNLKKEIHDKLDEVQVGIMHQGEKLDKIREDDELSRSKTLDRLSRLHTQTNDMAKAHDMVTKHMLDWTQNQDSRWDNFEHAIRSEIVQRFEDRQSRICSIEKDLQSVANSYAAKIEAMKELILQSDEEAKIHLGNTIEAIHNALSKGLDETRDRSERAISASETVNASIQTCLKEFKEKFVDGSQHEPQRKEIHQALSKDKSKVLDLQQHVTPLEPASEPSKAIRDKWQGVTKSIDTLKAQLQDMSGRIPKVETMEARFQNMLQVNQVLNATTNYLMAEHTWVNQHLEDKPNSEAQEVNAESPLASQDANAVKDEPTLDSFPEAVVVWNQSIDLVDPVADMTGREEATRRRVVINSPRGDTTSPSPPPSVGKEQRRRREAAAPRSIMRFSASQESTQELRQSRITPNHSQYNRPVESKAVSVVVADKQDMIDQIRSGLVRPKAAEKNWELPTVADFERQAKTSSYDSEIARKHGMGLPEKNQGANAKRVRVDDRLSQTVPESKPRSLQQSSTKKPGVLLLTC